MGLAKNYIATTFDSNHLFLCTETNYSCFQWKQATKARVKTVACYILNLMWFVSSSYCQFVFYLYNHNYLVIHSRASDKSV